jgi:hypothetical protein
VQREIEVSQPSQQRWAKHRAVIEGRLEMAAPPEHFRGAGVSFQGELFA